MELWTEFLYTDTSLKQEDLLKVGGLYNGKFIFKEYLQKVPKRL